MVAVATSSRHNSPEPISQEIKMLLNLSAKSLGLLVIGVVSTTGSNLRTRRAAQLHDSREEAPKTIATNQRLRAPEDAEEDSHAQSATDVQPSLSMDKPIYAESEPIAVTLSVGSPTHPYYSSPDAPSRRVDRNYPEWSVGLFMRDADPQGGRLSPIVSINLCGAMDDGCDASNRSYASYSDVTVTFGDADAMGLMQGTWPLEVSRYGTGFDAYVLDGRGAAAIGPLEFDVQNDSEEDVDAFHSHGSEAAEYRTSSSGSVGSGAGAASSSKAKNPLLKYNKGTKKSTERVHASVAKTTTHAASKINTNIENGNGPEMSSNAVRSEEKSPSAASEGQETTGPSKGHIHSDKEKYERDDSVTIDFSVAHLKEELDGYSVGIYMRSAHPQGGEIEPVVSLPLCLIDGPDNCISGSDDMTTGLVTFSSETLEGAMGWPIDLQQWGTAFSAYVLDENRNEVAGPATFDIMMNDTY